MGGRPSRHGGQGCSAPSSSSPYPVPIRPPLAPPHQYFPPQTNHHPPPPFATRPSPIFPPPTTTMASDLALPYPHCDRALRALALSAEGFGRNAIGGLHGRIYSVTSLQDKGPGTLREACAIKEPLWIVFEVSGIIHLETYLRVSSYKTIDGRGQQVTLDGKGLQLKECEHVIICNLKFQNGVGHDVDGIQIKPNSRHIWIDRCSLTNYDDGLIDITRQSTDITVSRCRFSNHDKTMLIGADATHTGDRCIRVTIHHCFFNGTEQRHPRLRYGKVHLYNNYTVGWRVYAICASVEAQLLSQHNIYEAVGDKKRAFRYMPEKAPDRDVDACAGWIRSEGDLFLNGAQAGLDDGAELVFKAEEFYTAWTMCEASLALKDYLQRCTGWQDVARPADAAVS